MENKKKGFGAALKGSVRMIIVGLKRKPQIIALLSFVIAFLYYSLHLTTISNTTAKIQGNGMGLCGFITMLFSILAILCFSNSFPYRKPVKKAMLVLMFLMVAAIITADLLYINQIYYAISRPDNPIAVTMNTVYIAYAEYYLRVHIVLLGISVALTGRRGAGVQRGTSGNHGHRCYFPGHEREYGRNRGTH